MLLNYHPTKKETEIHTPNHSEPPPDLIDGNEEYEIEVVLAHKGNVKGKRRFLISWKGYPSSENSWLPDKEMQNALEILETYKGRLKLFCLFI